jgi:hypothetical protein
MRIFLICLLLAMPIESCDGNREIAPAKATPIVQPKAAPSPTPLPSPPAEPLPPCIESGAGEVACYPIDHPTGKFGR